MESRFGHDFGDVRVHTGAQAASSARALGASAYTVGSHIVVGDGYMAGSAAGQRLLAHELTHVIQQRAGSGLDGAAAEVEADAVAAGSARIRAGSGPPRERVQRQQFHVRAGRISEEEVQDIVDNRDPTTLPRRLGECQAGTRKAKIFPVRTTRFGSATLSAERDGDDIVVKIPVHVHSDSDFDAQTRTLPTEVFIGGLRMPRWEVVKVHLYESPWYAPNITGSTGWDRESEFCIPADGLLQISDAIVKATILNIALTAVEALTLGAGGKAASAIGGQVVRGGRTALVATMLGTAEAAPTAIAGIASRTATTIAAPAVAGAVERQVTTQAATQAVTQAVRAEVTTQAAQVAIRSSVAAPVIGATVGAGTVEVAGQVARPQIAGAQEIQVSPADYQRILESAFASHALDPLLRVVDQVGERAGRAAVANARFVTAVRGGDWKLAGTLFHSEAAREVRALSASALPAGWRLEAESVVQAGAGGSRIDVLAHGPNGLVMEFDWKTTGRSALSSAARKEMRRHAGQITARLGGQLATQDSRSWVDFVRALLPGVNWPK
jgi:hypothetical protein